MTFERIKRKLERLRNSGREDPNRLFDGDDHLFKDLASKAKTYIEFGCGKSTDWVFRNSRAEIFAVDTSATWADRIRAIGLGDGRLQVEWIDVGPIGDWGRPTTFANRTSFQRYAEWSWRMAREADLVLIDGRFRVCCFLTSLKRARVGTKILFDDYRDRPHYHVVEEFLAPTDWCGRQALFEVTQPAKDGVPEIEIERFSYVID